MLKNGNILIFDNGSGRGWSRIIEVNPIGKEIVWEYHAEPKESFITRYWGSAQGLPNVQKLKRIFPSWKRLSFSLKGLFCITSQELLLAQSPIGNIFTPNNSSKSSM